jgi:hypothetical protein
LPLTPGYNAFHTHFRLQSLQTYCTDIGDQPSPDSEGDPLTVLNLQAIKKKRTLQTGTHPVDGRPLPTQMAEAREPKLNKLLIQRESPWTRQPATGSSANDRPDPATASKCNQAEQTTDSEGVPMDQLASCNVPICLLANTAKQPRGSGDPRHQRTMHQPSLHSQAKLSRSIKWSPQLQHS